MLPERIAYLRAKYPGVLFAYQSEREQYFDEHPDERMTTTYTLSNLERQIDIAEAFESYLPNKPADVRREARAMLVEHMGEAMISVIDTRARQSLEHVERRLLVLALCEPRWLSSMVELEANDFTAYAHKAIWAAIRELQLTASDIGPCEVFDALVMGDMSRERTSSHWVSLDWLQRLIATTTDFDGVPDELLAHFVEADQRALRYAALSRGRL